MKIPSVQSTMFIRGAILNSFKELSANSSDYLLQVRQHRLDFGYTFNDPLALHGFSVFARNQHNQFTNDTFIPFTNDIHSTGITAGCNLIDRISFSYSGTAHWFTGKSETENRLSAAPRLNLYKHSYSVATTLTSLFILSCRPGNR